MLISKINLYCTKSNAYKAKNTNFKGVSYFKKCHNVSNDFHKKATFNIAF